MKRFLISAGALTALAITSAPAVAAPVSATSQANAHARLFRPLTITSVRDLDLGTIVLSGPAPYTDVAVGITKGGTFSCDANLTCSGTTQTAQYKVTGTNNQTVTVIVSPTIAMANQSVPAAPALTLAVDAPGTVALGASGNAGVTFDIGGSIKVSDTTTEGVYLGTFDVSADYQ